MRHRGRTGVDHGSICNIWSLLSPSAQQLDYCAPELNEFHQAADWEGYWNLNLLFLSFQQSVLVGNGEVDSWSSWGWISLNLFNLKPTFHLPVRPCLCCDRLSAQCNLYCSEWGSGTTARVSTQLINNDRIYHFSVTENDTSVDKVKQPILLKAWVMACNGVQVRHLFRFNHAYASKSFPIFYLLDWLERNTKLLHFN